MLYTHQSVFIKHLKQKFINTLVYLQLKKKNQIETNTKNNLILIAMIYNYWVAPRFTNRTD